MEIIVGMAYSDISTDSKAKFSGDFSQPSDSEKMQLDVGGSRVTFTEAERVEDTLLEQSVERLVSPGLGIPCLATRAPFNFDQSLARVKSTVQ
jgi:hypothetical protein